jgi:hypothetical protein
VRPALDAALDVRAQRQSPLGCLRLIDLGLLLIAELGATCLAGDEHVKRQPVGPRHVGNGEIEPLLSISVAMKATLRLKRSSFATSKVALRLFASAIAAASCGRHALWQNNAEAIEESGLSGIGLGHAAQTDMSVRCSRQHHIVRLDMCQLLEKWCAASCRGRRAAAPSQGSSTIRRRKRGRIGRSHDFRRNEPQEHRSWVSDPLLRVLRRKLHSRDSRNAEQLVAAQ